MKKIIIVNNNMKVGGVQKSLYNLLWALEGKCEVTLFLFQPVGEYMEKLPPWVTVMSCSSLFRYLGISQGECRSHPADMLKRGFLAAVCRLMGRDMAMKLILPSQNILPEEYDCAISFLHNGRRKGFYGGCQDFVLNCVQAKRKAAFLHCDYHRCGANHPENNRMLENFHWIAACSDGCRASFAACVPGLREKCVTVRNCHRIDEIRSLAEEDSVEYDGQYTNVLMVSRLTHEKAIHRGIFAVKHAWEKGYSVRLHIIGGGPMEKFLRQTAQEQGVADRVFFYGEQGNPYRFMKCADLFLLTSHHEAAPLVIEEARCVGLPVLTVQTTSSDEMVTGEGCGWVCENSQEALNTALEEALRNGGLLRRVRSELAGRTMGNDAALTQFMKLIEG